MRVLVAGATGAVGRPLLPMLAAAGHEVVGITRSEAKAGQVRDAGAEPAIVDVHDTDALRRVVTAAAPEVVVNELTALPDEIDFRDAEALAPTNALRREVGPALAKIAAEAGARRLIAQSVAFFYAPVGGPIKSEDDPLMKLPADSPMGGGPPALQALERSTLETPGLDGLVLRYGYFYGPGTSYATDHSTVRLWDVGCGQARALGSSPSSTPRTPRPRPWRRSSAARPASTTSPMTSRRRWRSGSRPTPRRSTPRLPAGFRFFSPA